MSPDLTVDVDGGVAVLTLNRPERLNAYTAAMGSADAREGVAAFLERRPPSFTARLSREWEPPGQP